MMITAPVPAFGGNFGKRVAALAQDLPECLGTVGAAREAARHADDGNIGLAPGRGIGQLLPELLNDGV